MVAGRPITTALVLKGIRKGIGLLFGNHWQAGSRQC